METNITELKEQIYFQKTREYFDEIEKSFYSESYRSAVVMLYSVVIADLLYKLEELKDYYSDTVAENIINEVNSIRKANPKSSEWENKLIERISKETSIIEPYILVNIEHLKEIRNFSAHPSLDQNNELIKPSREKTLGLIKDMLIGIFIRPPLFIKKITTNILEDISNKKEDFLLDNSKFKKYIRKKYFDKIPENMIINVFKDFWKLTFKTENEDCNQNRDINLGFLLITMQDYKLKILENIRKDKQKYNNISDNSNIVIYLVEFIYYYPEVYTQLSDENKIIIDVATNNKKDYKLLMYYAFKNLEEQLKELSVENFNNLHTKELFEKKVEEDGEMVLIIDKYMKFFADSYSYNEADDRFNRFIRPYISKMDLMQVKKLIEIINTNNQIYGRGRAEFDNNDIIKRANIDWQNINLDDYEKFEYDYRLLIKDELPF